MIDPSHLDEILSRASRRRPDPLPPSFTDSVIGKLEGSPAEALANVRHLVALPIVAVVVAGATAFLVRPEIDSPPPLTVFESPAGSNAFAMP